MKDKELRKALSWALNLYESPSNRTIQVADVVGRLSKLEFCLSTLLGYLNLEYTLKAGVIIKKKRR